MFGKDDINTQSDLETTQYYTNGILLHYIISWQQYYTLFKLHIVLGNCLGLLIEVQSQFVVGLSLYNLFPVDM